MSSAGSWLVFGANTALRILLAIEAEVDSHVDGQRVVIGGDQDSRAGSGDVDKIVSGVSSCVAERIRSDRPAGGEFLKSEKTEKKDERQILWQLFDRSPCAGVVKGHRADAPGLPARIGREPEVCALCPGGEDKPRHQREELGPTTLH
jgi:hypothetical protein